MHGETTRNLFGPRFLAIFLNSSSKRCAMQGPTSCSILSNSSLSIRTVLTAVSVVKEAKVKRFLYMPGQALRYL